MTTIGYLGNYRHSWCTEVYIAQALEALGCTVLRWQEDRFDPGDVEARARAEGVDAVLYTRTWGKLPALTDVWRRLEADGVKTASYHLDLYLGLEREATLEGDPFWTTQYVFTPDGDPASQAEFERRGINHHWVPPAIGPGETYRGRVAAMFASDVIFVGSQSYHPEWPYRQELLAKLREWYGDRFRRYGGGADVVRGAHLNDLYASAKVVVGDTLCPGFTKPNYWSDRPYETVGRGGFLVMPHVRGLETHFDDDAHLRFYTFGHWDQLRDLIDDSLAKPYLREQVSRAGIAHVAANHTYRHRLADALQIMELLDG